MRWIFVFEQLSRLMREMGVDVSARDVLILIVLLLVLPLFVLLLAWLTFLRLHYFGNPKRVLDTGWVPQSIRDWLRRRNTQKRWKSKGVSPTTLDLWQEWNQINAAGRDAYYRRDYAEAEHLFEALLTMTQRIGLSFPGPVPHNLEESSRWWQAAIVREGVCDWNAWRQANRDIMPDLRGQDLSLENLAPPCSPDDQLQERGIWNRDLKSANFEDTDLTSACLYFSDLAGANLRGANLQNTNLYDCDLSMADFREANFSGAIIEGSHLHGANLMDAIGLTDQQVASACGGPNTAL